MKFFKETFGLGESHILPFTNVLFLANATYPLQESNQLNNLSCKEISKDCSK